MLFKCRYLLTAFCYFDHCTTKAVLLVITDAKIACFLGLHLTMHRANRLPGLFFNVLLSFKGEIKKCYDYVYGK